MKLIDKSGKLFGKISVLDILIVVSVVFIATVFILNSSKQIKLPISTKANTEYIVEFKAYNIEKGTQAPFAVGDNLYANTGELIGEIVEVESKPMITKEKLQNGTYFDFESEKSLDYFITVKGLGTVTEKGLFAQGTFALYPSNSVQVSSRSFYGNVIVLSVEK